MLDINELGSHEQLRVVDDMNNSTSKTQASICYEQLRVVDDMNYFES